MNWTKACNILEIPIDQDITIEIIKRQYHRKALKYHPDKNNSPDASHIFQELNEAHEYITNHYINQTKSWFDTNKNDADDDSEQENNKEPANRGYIGILYSFLKNVIGKEVFDETQSRIFYIIIQNLTCRCEVNVLKILGKLDRSILIKIYKILEMHQEVFHFSDSFLQNIRDIIQVSTHNDERVILYTFLEDMLADSLYKLTHFGHTYYVPLWMDELVYDVSGSDLYVQCVPILPDNITIDTQNNVHVLLEYNIGEIWGKVEILVNLDKGTDNKNISRSFAFKPDQLKITGEKQTIVFAGQGISRINTLDIYNVKNRGDILLHILVKNECKE